MIFKKLELKNFKSHSDTTIEFNKGITLIVGNNGAGKSSIFDAISFALFKLKNTKNISDLVRTNKEKENKVEMEVKLTFEDDEEYRVERKVILTKSKSKSDDSIKINTKTTSSLFKIINGQDELIAENDRDVNEKIKEKLSIDSTTFLNAIHIKQGEIASLIDKSAGERKELIGKLLGLEKLEKAYSNMLSVLKIYELKIAELNGKKKPAEELEKELHSFQQEKLDLIKANGQMNEESEKLKKKIEIKNKEKEDLDEEKSKFETLNMKLEHENDKLNLLNKSNEELREQYDIILKNEEEMKILEPFSKKLSIYNGFKESLSILNQLKKDEERNNETLNQIETYNKIILDEKENHEKYMDLEKEIKELRDKEVELSSETKRISELESEKRQLEDDIKQYGSDLNDLSVFSKEILTQFDLQEEIKEIKTNDDLKNLSSLLESIITKVQAEIEELNNSIELSNKECIRLIQENESLKEPLSEIKVLENKCPVCQSDISEDKKNELIDMYEGTISSNTKKIDENNGILEKLNYDKSLKDSELEGLNSIKTKIYQNQHLVDDLDKSNQSLVSLSEKIKVLYGKKEELDSLEKIIESKNNEFKELEQHNDDYTKAKTLLDSSPEESKIKEELDEIRLKINAEDEKIKEYISKENELSLDISEDSLNESIKDLTEKDNRYRMLLGSIQGKEDHEEKLKTNSNDIENKVNEIEKIKKDIDDSTYDEELYKKAMSLLESLNERYNQLSKEIAVNNTNLDVKEAKISEIEKDIEKNNDIIKECDDAKKYHNLLKEFRELYSKDGIQKDLRSYSKPLIEKYTKEFFEKFDFEYSDLSLDDEYNISISGEGVANTDMVSGGEKIAIALALRLGITQAMSEGNIETILLDEPTIHLDSFRRQELINILHSISVIPQMLIVTHDFELESAADTVIKVEKENGISKVELDI